MIETITISQLNKLDTRGLRAGMYVVLGDCEGLAANVVESKHHTLEAATTSRLRLVRKGMCLRGWDLRIAQVTA